MGDGGDLGDLGALGDLGDLGMAAEVGSDLIDLMDFQTRDLGMADCLDIFVGCFAGNWNWNWGIVEPWAICFSRCSAVAFVDLRDRTSRPRP